MSHTIKITMFESLYKSIGKGKSAPIEVFAEVLKKQRPIESKTDAKLFSGTLFKKGKPRGIETALETHVLVFDFDNAPKVDTAAKPVQIQDVAEALRAVGVQAFLATTFSHTPSVHRFRVVTPLLTPVPARDWIRFATACVDHLGLSAFTHGMDLGALNDVAHIYFLPSCPEGRTQQFVEVEGDLLDPKDVTLGPADAQKAGNRTTVKVNGSDQDMTQDFGLYKGDLRTLDIVALLTAEGFEPVTNASGFHYFECPWQDEHSHPGGSSAWVKKKPNRFPRFSCWHDACAERGLIDLLAEFEPGEVDAHCKGTFDPTEPYDPSEVGKPEIVMDFNLERTVDRCIEVLAESGVVFCRGNVLVDLPGYMEYLRRQR
jgi:hypothetical protein